ALLNACVSPKNDGNVVTLDAFPVPATDGGVQVSLPSSSGAGSPPASGDVLWKAETGEWNNALTFDKAGNLYRAGTAFNLDTTGPDVAVSKYDPSGVLLWSKTFKAPGDQLSQAVAVAADGRIALVGQAEGGDFGNDVRLAQIGNRDAFIVT